MAVSDEAVQSVAYAILDALTPLKESDNRIREKAKNSPRDRKFFEAYGYTFPELDETIKKGV